MRLKPWHLGHASELQELAGPLFPASPGHKFLDCLANGRVSGSAKLPDKLLQTIPRLIIEINAEVHYALPAADRVTAPSSSDF